MPPPAVPLTASAREPIEEWRAARQCQLAGRQLACSFWATARRRSASFSRRSSSFFCTAGTAGGHNRQDEGAQSGDHSSSHNRSSLGPLAPT